jgi:biopolymer transport protein TolQ
MNAWDAILSASPIVQLTLLCLVILSIWSWAIVFEKRRSLGKASDQNEAFLDTFWKASSFDTVFGQVKNYPSSPMAQVFHTGYLELQRMAESEMARGDDKDPKLSGIDNLERSLRKSIEKEVTKMEGGLTLLATTGSTGPFIGLFGTVWGIMGSFQKIGATGNASLAVVAPGISEALIATAVGLAAAIPAVIAYNNFTARIRREEVDLNNFGSDVMNIAKRNFFKDS